MNKLVMELKKLGCSSLIRENREFHADTVGLKRPTSKATLALGEHFGTEEVLVHGGKESGGSESKSLPKEDERAPLEDDSPAE